MAIWEIILIGVALAMDAVAVGMTDGMLEPEMKSGKSFLVAGAFAFFQFFMPVLGYYAGIAFSEFFGRIAPWLSFALLSFIGGKMIFDCCMERKKGKDGIEKPRKLGAGKLLLQAVATSIDALAVGVTFIAAEASRGLPMHAVFCALLIGAVTFLLSLPAVFLGKRVGDKLKGKAEILGGVILIAIGLKILLEGIFA